MKFVNVVFEYDYDDVDIILVPDDIADNIEQVVQLFIHWLSNPDNGKQFLKTLQSGQIGMIIETESFLFWLNNYKITNGAKASIVMQHTKYNSKYPMAEF